MSKEIERKFLVKNDSWRALGHGTLLCQGYLQDTKECTVRVRTVEGRAFLTIKGVTVGMTRAEYEYEIPFADARAMLETLAEKPLIEKKRYTISHGGLLWEVDEFFGENKGLIVAEVELPCEEQPLILPNWVGDEVTDDPRYFNSYLVRHPFAIW